jgi:hypothetical protein
VSRDDSFRDPDPEGERARVRARYEIPGAPAEEDVDAFLAGLRGREVSPLTTEEADLVIGKLREGGVVRTAGADDYTFFSFRAGQFAADTFNMGRRTTREMTEADVRNDMARLLEFRMLLPPTE